MFSNTHTHIVYNRVVNGGSNDNERAEWTRIMKMTDNIYRTENNHFAF